MSIEQALQENTAALNALREAILKGGAAPAATGAAEKTTRGKGKAEEGAAEKTVKKGYEAKHTKAEAQAAINEVKEAKGTPAAKAILKEVGLEKLADLDKAEDIDKLYELSKAALGEDGDGEDI